MRLIALDPSSTCTGWAVFEPIENLLACGKITFPKKLLVKRLFELRLAVENLISEHGVLRSVVEIPSPRVWNSGNGYGLVSYGMAVGVVLASCWRAGLEVHTVTEDVWTARQPKRKRLMLVNSLYSQQYRLHSDKGLDISDAIALGNWFLAKDRLYCVADNFSKVKSVRSVKVKA